MSLSMQTYGFIFTQTLRITTILICIIIGIIVFHSRKDICSKLLKFKAIFSLLIIYLFLWVVVYGSYVIRYKVRVDSQFKKFISSLEMSTSFRAQYYYYSKDLEKFELEEKLFEDSEDIEILIQIIRENDFKWFHLGGALTKSYVKYELFKDEKKISTFRIINPNMLEVLSADELDCYFSLDSELYFKSNHKLGIKPGVMK